MIEILQSEPEAWISIILAKFKEFKELWSSVYAGDQNKLINPFLTDLMVRADVIGYQILSIASNSPSNINSEIITKIVDVSTNLSQLGQTQFYMDGGDSMNNFDEKGNEIERLIDEIIKQLGTDFLVLDKN